MEKVGARLKKMRLEKGLSIEEVQKKTKIHANILRAIEEDDFINLSPIYVKGFLKIYCKFLEVDSAGFISDYMNLNKVSVSSQPEPKKAKDTHNEPSIPSEKKVSLRIPADKIRLILKLGGIFLAVVLVFGFLGFTCSKVRSISKNKKSSAAVDKTHVEKAKVTTKNKKVPPPKEKKTSAPVITPKQEIVSAIRVGIRAREDCYVKMTIDGKVVYQNVLRKGRFENWQAQKEIRFSLGNAGGVDVEVNGKFLPSLGRKGQAVKNIVVNEEGLKTGQ